MENAVKTIAILAKMSREAGNHLGTYQNEIQKGIEKELLTHFRANVGVLADLLGKDDAPLNFAEIDAGQKMGKLEAVKMYKNRTGVTLMQAKKSVEEYFGKLGLEFRVYKYY